MLHSVRARLTLWYTAILALVLVTFSAVSYVLLSRAIHAQNDASLTDAAHDFVAAFNPASRGNGALLNYRNGDHEIFVLPPNGRIAGALANMHAHWHIVVGHHTIFSSGMHGRANNATQTNVRELLPLLRQNHVDLYICGHDHDMELLGELHRGPESDPLFLVSGAGSGTDEMRPRRATVKEPPTIYPQFPATVVMGFAVLQIDATRLTVTFFDHDGRLIGGPFTTVKR